jgi:predicted secreted acid phosphatase
MVFVDLSNPHIRKAICTFNERQRERLGKLAGMLEAWVADSLAAEAIHSTAREIPARPMAAVIDIDEILLCNIHENYFLGVNPETEESVIFYAADHFVGADGKPWPRTETRLGPALAGAEELLRQLAALGVEVFLVSGRRESLRAETMENFEATKLARFLTPAQIMLCPDDYPAHAPIRPFKEACRGVINQTHRIVLNLGDQASDLGYYGDRQVLCEHPFYWTP